jgi:hypothetical protein
MPQAILLLLLVYRGGLLQGLLLKAAIPQAVICNRLVAFLRNGKESRCLVRLG